MRIEFDYKEYTISVFEQNEQLYIEVWAEVAGVDRIAALKNINIVAVKMGIPGIIGPDLIYNIGKLAEETRQKALDKANPADIMEDEDETSLGS